MLERASGQAETNWDWLTRRDAICLPILVGLGTSLKKRGKEEREKEKRRIGEKEKSGKGKRRKEEKEKRAKREKKKRRKEP